MVEERSLGEISTGTGSGIRYSHYFIHSHSTNEICYWSLNTHSFYLPIKASSIPSSIPPFLSLTPSDTEHWTKIDKQDHLSKPKPEPLQPVPRLQLRPVRILGVQDRLAGKQVGLKPALPLGPLGELPPKVEEEEDGHADVSRDEACEPTEPS